MTYKTAITDIREGREFIRGHELTSLMKEKSFTEVIFFILRGELPTKKEEQMLDALLVAAIDHGPGTASAQTARIVASAKNSMHTSLAAGILAMGELHGSAIEGAASFFQEYKSANDLATLISEKKAAHIRIPGFGHAVLTVDHRANELVSIAEELGVAGDHVSFMQKVHEELNKQSSKPLPLNIDGAMAAILLDLGFPVHLMKGIFIIARMPGLVAQVTEEVEQGGGIRRLPQEDIEYIGM